MASRRRGALSKDEDAIARRKWYSDMQSIVFKRADAKNDEAAERLALLETSAIGVPLSSSASVNSLETYSYSHDAKSIRSTAPPVEIKKEVALVSKVAEFKSFALELAVESEQKQLERDNYVEKEPEIIPFSIPEELNPHRWIIRLNTLARDTTLVCRLVCFPGVNGSHMLFKKWSSFLEPLGIELWAICLPGRAHRVNEPFMEVVQDVAECIVQSMYDLDLLPDAGIFKYCLLSFID